MSKHVWVVQRRGFNGRLLSRMTFPDKLPHVPMCVFSEPHQAEAYRLELERIARWTMNPFTLGTWAEMTSHTQQKAEQLLAWLVPRLTGEIYSPDHPALSDWAKWWERKVGQLTDDEIDAAWEVFDRLVLYQVVSVPLDPPTPEAAPASK